MDTLDYDVLVVGGGASGLFLAAHTAAAGLHTLVLERRERPARKLMITGKGRCNVCNNCDSAAFLEHVVHGGRFLYSAADAFKPQDTMAWFEAHGVPLKTERGGRVFPVSDQARDIVDALTGAVKDAGGVIRCETVRELLLGEGRVHGVLCESGARYGARAVVVATGGMSYPATGSTGDGYRFARDAGHTLVPPAPALTPLVCVEKYPARCMGLSLRNITLALWDRKKPKKPVYQELGEVLFTHFGLSGPLALTASSMLDAARPREYHITLDLKPALSADVLDARVQRDFKENINRGFGNALDALLPRTLVPVIVELSGVPPLKKIHDVTRQERAALVALLKALPLSVKALGSPEEAIITRGGVAVKEIHPKSMESKLCSGLYFTGEVLDCDALTGGYNLQIAFSTAFLAAQQIKEVLS